ncbi:predicted glucosamine-6-phosphate isomerase [Psychromonas ingrahamii 37]|uniref:Predicted glucosamine-6-phosphate isomerase n=1 Tax=Psychromonas ingrahamii (strain DSM 17664 / CCUG 51855 / 37) TaxID=357804 RepID=A1T021_PSYIN|nr:hypothetical protein [Psychromonas ingrahamii]ABM05086.1 predicted glucosamine-6-phosphate isomerase [Psychromonas ingrahamii 37]
MKIDKRQTFVLITLLLALFGCNNDSDSSVIRSEEAQVNVDKGIIALNEGNFNEALALLGKAEALSSSDSETQLLRGKAYAGRAGVSVKSITQSLTANRTDGTTELAPSSSNIMGIMNYYDENEFKIRTTDTNKALALFVEQDPSLESLSNDDRATLAALAAVNATQNITLILKGDNPMKLSDQEIKNLVEDNFDAQADSLIKATDLALKLKYELVTAITATTGSITTAVVDASLTGSSLSDLENSKMDKAAFTTFMQTFNNDDRI